MSHDLTSSQVARQNVLNNNYALQKIEEHLEMHGLEFEGQTVFTKAMVANLLDVDERTVDRYLTSNSDELKLNGYQVLKGKPLKNIKLSYVDDINVADMIDPKAPSLGIFPFKAMLNMAMLVTESERARAIRSRMLDIVIDAVAEKAGGHTKFINQRDQDYLPAAYLEDSYRKQFTDALRDCLEMGNHRDVGRNTLRLTPHGKLEFTVMRNQRCNSLRLTPIMFATGDDVCRIIDACGIRVGLTFLR